MKERICKHCGSTFQGNDTTEYCPECRIEKQMASGVETSRTIGSTDKCIICGKEYVISASKQKYCPECAAAGKTAQPYKYTKAEGRAKAKWRQKAYDRFELNFPKGYKQTIADHAAKHNESLNQFVQRAVQTQMNIDNESESTSE